MKQSLNLLLFIVAVCLPAVAITQDMDQDSINDLLEEALAQRFAPEWRFHHEIPGDASNQNEDEAFYPVSIEFFYNQIVVTSGQPPQLLYGGNMAPLPDLNNLDKTLVPGTQVASSDTSWHQCNSAVQLVYPEKIPGDPDGFPTYYRCYKTAEGQIAIGYLLFYPYDYKGKYSLILFDLEFGQHRGDWEGINVLISGITDFDNPAAIGGCYIERVKYSGHGPTRYVTKDSPNLCTIDGTHPTVYISWGSHTPYPVPGEWHDYKVDFPFGLGNVYDDFFYGNGLAVQAWSASRQLVNLGEEMHPFTGWLNYAGRWGPDDNGGNSSPNGPRCKSAWTHEVTGWTTWEEAILPANYEPYWEEPFEPAGLCSDIVSTGSPVNDQVEIWPNPVSKVLRIDFKSTLSNPVYMNLFDSRGQLMQSEVLFSRQTSIVTAQLHPGLYFLQMSDGKEVRLTYKFIKQD